MLPKQTLRKQAACAKELCVAREKDGRLARSRCKKTQSMRRRRDMKLDMSPTASLTGIPTLSKMSTISRYQPAWGKPLDSQTQHLETRLGHG